MLKPGGRVVIIAETYRRDGGVNALARSVVRLVGGACLSVDEHRDALNDAGFADVILVEERRKGWLSARGQSLAAVPQPAAVTQNPTPPLP